MQFLIVLLTQEMHGLAETILLLILSLSVPLGKKFALSLSLFFFSFPYQKMKIIATYLPDVQGNIFEG